MTQACMISTDAFRLAVKFQIPIILIQRNGKPIGKLWSHGYGRISTIRRRQVEFADTAAAGSWVVDMVFQKYTEQLAFLEKLEKRLTHPPQKLIDNLAKIKEKAGVYETLKHQPVAQIRHELAGLEGGVSYLYLRALNSCLPKKYQFAKRSRRPAKDQFNAALNYLYGVLYHQIELALIQTGIDPELPILHEDKAGRPAFVYDFIEPYRPWVDQVVFGLCMAESLLSKHIQVREKGLWMSSSGKELLLNSYETFFGQLIYHNDRRRSRKVQIELDSQAFATQMLKKKW